jgi:hypothetical protein
MKKLPISWSEKFLRTGGTGFQPVQRRLKPAATKTFHGLGVSQKLMRDCFEKLRLASVALTFVWGGKKQGIALK